MLYQTIFIYEYVIRIIRILYVIMRVLREIRWFLAVIDHSKLVA